MSLNFNLIEDVEIAVDNVLHTNANLCLFTKVSSYLEFLENSNNDLVEQDSLEIQNAVLPVITKTKLIILVPSIFLVGEQQQVCKNTIIVKNKETTELLVDESVATLFLDWVPTDWSLQDVVWRLRLEYRNSYKRFLYSCFSEIINLESETYLISRKAPVWYYLAHWLKQENDVIKIVNLDKNCDRVDYLSGLHQNASTLTKLFSDLICSGQEGMNCVLTLSFENLLYASVYLFGDSALAFQKVVVYSEKPVVEYLSNIQCYTDHLTVDAGYDCMNIPIHPFIRFLELFNSGACIVTTNTSEIAKILSEFHSLLIIVDDKSEFPSTYAQWERENENSSALTNSVGDAIQTKNKNELFAVSNLFYPVKTQVDFNELIDAIMPIRRASLFVIRSIDQCYSYRRFINFYELLYYSIYLDLNWPEFVSNKIVFSVVSPTPNAVLSSLVFPPWVNFETLVDVTLNDNCDNIMSYNLDFICVKNSENDYCINLSKTNNLTLAKKQSPSAITYL